MLDPKALEAAYSVPTIPGRGPGVFSRARLSNAITAYLQAAQPAVTVKPLELIDEGLGILTNLIDGITRHGNYSPENTCVFIDQGAAAIREAKRVLQAAPSTASKTTTKIYARFSPTHLRKLADSLSV